MRDRDTRRRIRAWQRQLRGAIIALAAFVSTQAAGDDSLWAHYGGDIGGQRFSRLAQINRGNVGTLVEAWRYSTGEMRRRGEAIRHSAFEATPILAAGHLVFCTPFNRVVALDPATGAERWTFDPGIRLDIHPATLFVCRGVAQWRDSAAPPDAPCAHRIFTATVDLRLIAIDARNGRRCPQFGANGDVRVEPDMPLTWPGEMQFGSPPVIVGDTVIVGSEIADNMKAHAPSGRVRAFDARSGAPRWTFEPIRDPADRRRSGHANVWAPMSADPARDLVFVPTSSPSPDHMGSQRPGDNRDANSVVALRASTGERVWAFQTIHHDLWDYDLASQPTLFTLTRDRRRVDAVLQPSKTGFLFVLDRLTGAPLHPVVEQAVPASDVPEEQAWPTQPIPLRPPPLVPQHLKAEDAWGATPADREACRARLAGLRSEGLFTPPSLRGTVFMPHLGGGANWGSAAVHPDRAIAVINMSNLVHVVQLIPRALFDGERRKGPAFDVQPQGGTPYGVRRTFLRAPGGLPCNPPPWGILAAVDLAAGTVLWRVPLGHIPGVSLPGGVDSGTVNIGGPIITAAGVVFVAATTDNLLRAFDVATGRELWRGRLPAGGQATPMTYEAGGRQFVVVAAGGHAWLGASLGDTVIAFALPR